MDLRSPAPASLDPDPPGAILLPMQITVEPHDQAAVLHLRGEFDTFSCPSFQDEVAALSGAGVSRVVVNLRLVQFINSTALGAILKTARSLQDAGGQLVISHPSTFCRDILGKIGLDRVITVTNTDAEALAALTDGAPAPDGPEQDFEEDPSTLLFRPSDPSRLEHFLEKPKAENPVHGHAFGSHWSGVAKMTALDAGGLTFTWGGGKTGMSPFDMGQFLAVGTGLSVKFKLPLLQKGFSEAAAEVTELAQLEDSVEVTVTFDGLDAETAQAVAQYVADMGVLKDELKRTTEG